MKEIELSFSQTNVSPIFSTTHLPNNLTETVIEPVFSMNHENQTKLYIIIYSLLILASICLTTARSMLFYKISMNASRGLHNKMFSCILRAPMRFFDTNPSGKNLLIADKLHYKIFETTDYHAYPGKNRAIFGFFHYDCLAIL